MKKILLTGGVGYIGSHTAVELHNAGYHVILVDNFSNSSSSVLENLQRITNTKFPFYEADCTDNNVLKNIFEIEKPDAVIHFAAFKAVGESVSNPLKYYRNNLDSLITVLEVMQEAKCKVIVFSSSATVYGIPKILPIPETAETIAINPYGETKLVGEHILVDVTSSDTEISVAILRYFNPVGAHESGLIGENPKGIPNNLVPYIQQVAGGVLPELLIFGDDYETKDGTGERDYIHVVDLAEGHVAALSKAFEGSGLFTVNLGTGEGYTVLDLVKTFETVNSVKVPYRIVARRDGDAASAYANPDSAYKLLGWKAKKNLSQMMQDSWRWQKNSSDK